ncbi:MAG: hypothetical protein KAX50_03955 [Saprospiraceae bacterium]|nr:hypothetical protein [Saprospiraceae bacterium]
MQKQFSYSEAASRQAAEANQAALIARKHRDEYHRQKAIIEGWNGIMSNSSPLKLTVIAFVLALLNMLASWEMNWDILDQTGVFNMFGLEVPPKWSPLVIAIPLEALALGVAYWLGKAYYREIFEWGVWNRVHLIHKGNYHQQLAEKDETLHRSQNRLRFLILLGLVLIVQIGISGHRIYTLDNNHISALLAVLAAVFLMGEVVTGVYFDFLLKRMSLASSMQKSMASFNSAMTRCADGDRMVFELLGKAERQQHERPLSGDIARSIYRYQNRAQDSENYVDEISGKQISIRIQTSEGTAVANASIVGELPDGAITPPVFTNGNGDAILSWMGNGEYVEFIKANDVTFPGPFTKDAIYSLRLPRKTPINDVSFGTAN